VCDGRLLAVNTPGAGTKHRGGVLTDRPTAQELLRAIAHVLTETVQKVRAEDQHVIRVAHNLSQVLLREFDLAPERDRLDERALRSLLGEPSGKLEEMEAELSRRLLSAQTSELEEDAWPVLTAITERSLAVNKPGYSEWRAT
jgi:hypothetical protein